MFEFKVCKKKLQSIIKFQTLAIVTTQPKTYFLSQNIVQKLHQVFYLNF